MSSYFSSRFKFKPEFISLMKSSSLKYIEQKPGRGLSRRASTSSSAPSIKSIHFFRLLSLCGHVVPKKGILCKLIPFASCLMFPHLAATHLSGIFEKRAEYRDLFSVRSRERLKSRVPESTSQLLLNREETNANGGPKWRQI